MNDMKAGPIAGIFALAALVGVTVTMMRTGSTPLPQKVDDFLDKSRSETVQERHTDVAKRVEEIQALVSDPLFAKLPPEKQKAVKAHLVELSEYRDYVERLDKITPPHDAKKDEQLRDIKAGLVQLRVPIEYQVEWSQTEAGERHRQWLDDATALEKAVDAAEKGYQKVNADAETLRKDAEGANLPARAAKILAEGSKLPSPEADNSRKIPGSQNVTYATVFSFARVDFVYDKWKKNKEVLLNIKSLGK